MCIMYIILLICLCFGFEFEFINILESYFYKLFNNFMVKLKFFINFLKIY